MADWQGRLLVATPLLTAETFARTVVQLLAYDEEDGAFGVVLSRSTGTPLADVLPGWALLAPDPPYVFDGGPVQESAAVCLARVARTDTEPQGYVMVPGAPRLATVDLDRDAAPEIELVRVFAGYAGWSPGQLEAEVEEGAWWIVDGLPSDPFSDRPDLLWSRVLRRQGVPLAFAATHPGDPGLN